MTLRKQWNVINETPMDNSMSIMTTHNTNENFIKDAVYKK